MGVLMRIDMRDFDSGGLQLPNLRDDLRLNLVLVELAGNRSGSKSC